MPFILLAGVMVCVAAFGFFMAVHEKSWEFALGAGAVLLAGGGLLVLFLVFHA